LIDRGARIEGNELLLNGCTKKPVALCYLKKLKKEIIEKVEKDEVSSTALTTLLNGIICF
jgi:hypothetical protein